MAIVIFLTPLCKRLHFLSMNAPICLLQVALAVLFIVGCQCQSDNVMNVQTSHMDTREVYIIFTKMLLLQRHNYICNMFNMNNLNYIQLGAYRMTG